MQAKYDATKVMKAARECVTHYEDSAEGLEGNSKAQAQERGLACQRMQAALAQAIKGKAVILSTAEFMLLKPGWPDDDE